MRFDFNGADELTIGKKNGQAIKLRANGNGVYKNENGRLSVDIDDERLKGVELVDEFKPKPVQYTQAPKPPKWDSTPQQEKGFWDNVKGGANSFLKEIKRTGTAILEDSILGDYGTGASNADKARKDIARANNYEGLIKSILNKNKQNPKLQQAYEAIAKRQGFDMGVIVADDGRILAAKRDNNGEPLVMDLTPNFAEGLMANSKEIMGGVAGAFATRGGSLITPLITSAIGSGVGAYADAIKADEKTGAMLGSGGRLARAIDGFYDDLVVGGGIMATAKALDKYAKPSLKVVDKAIDIIPVVKKLRGQNIEGALAELEAQVGGKEVLQTLLKNIDESGTRVGVEQGNYLANQAKAGLQKVEQSLVGIEPKSKFLDKAKNTLQKSRDVIDNVSNILMHNDQIAKGQSDILSIARANERVAELGSDILKQNPTAAKNLNRTITKDTNKILDEFDRLKAGKTDTKDIALAYEQRIKDEFNQGLNELGKAYDGVFTTIKNTENGEQFLAEINALKNGVWGGMPNTKLKNIITKLADQREISINGVNALRSELNRLIKSADVNLSHIARNAKNYIEGEVLDDILSKTPFSSEARKLYETMVGEYRAMKGISDSGWFAKVSNRDIGERAINNAIAEVLEGGAKNNSVSEFLGKLKPDEVAGVELNLISRALDDSLATMANGGKVLDLNNIVSKIRNLGFRSDEAKYFANMIENLKGVIGQDFELAKAIGAFKKGEKLGQGITQKPLSRLKTMLANRTVKTIIRLAPIIGRQPSLIHHFEQAALKAKSYDGFINNIKQIAQRADVPSAIRTEIDNLLRAKNEAEVANDNKSAVEQMMQNAKLKAENEAGVYSQHAMLHSNNESLAKKDLKGNKLTNAQNRLIKEVDKNKLNSEQKAVYDVFTGKKDKVILQGKDLNDLYELESGSRVGGARKIMIRHAGTEKTGGLSSNELVNLMNVVREGKIVDNSFTLHDNKIRYAYELQKEGTKLRLVVDEFNDGKKVFDYYSDRNFVDYSKNQENGSALKQIMQRAREKAIQDLKKKQGSEVKGDDFVMRANGNIEFPPDFFFELDKALKSKTGISEKIEASLAWLRSRHPEIKSRSEIKRIIDYVINEPEVIKQKEMVKR